MIRRPVVRGRIAGFVAALFLTGARLARGQDFATPAPLPASGDLLERALPAAERDVALTALDVVRAAGLSTRSLAAGGGLGVVRGALGVARTGDAALGWSTGAGALGFATPSGGAALRGLVRSDDGASPGETTLGIEIGGGGWIALGAARVWASAPQAWLAGELPPLARGVTTGVDWIGRTGFAALAREAPRRGFAESAAYTARLGLAFGSLGLWTEVREDPWRGGVGVAADAGPFRCAVQVDAHPVLDPVTRIAITVRSPRRP